MIRLNDVIFLISHWSYYLPLQPLHERELADRNFKYHIIARASSGGNNGNWTIMKVISDYQQGTAAFNISGRQYTEVAIETQNEAGVGPSPSLFIQIAPLNQRKYMYRS